MRTIDAPREGLRTYQVPAVPDIPAVRTPDHHLRRDARIAVALTLIATFASASLREGDSTPFNGPKVDPVFNPDSMRGLAYEPKPEIQAIDIFIPGEFQAQNPVNSEA